MTSKYINVVWTSGNEFHQSIRCTGPDRGLCDRCSFRFRCYTELVLRISGDEIKEIYRQGRCKWTHPFPPAIYRGVTSERLPGRD